ncbi:MAG: septation protein SpoVG family protein [Planctomycetes bacterium]|nr:septation protein SpoVG family protein [Planctomycetota bacterium]
MNQPHRHPALQRLRRRRQTLRGSWRVGTATLTAITITPASELNGDDGLLAFLNLELDGLVRIDGVTLRLTEHGQLSLSFPSRTSRRGTKHALVRPTDRAARHAIERAIFNALGIRQEPSR